MVRKSPISQVLISNRVRNSKDHKVLISIQLRLPVVRIFYRHRWLQVHNEVLLKGKLSLIVLIVEESTRESVRSICLVGGSNEHKVKDCPRAIPSQRVMFHHCRKAAKVLHHLVFRGRGHRQ